MANAARMITIIAIFDGFTPTVYINWIDVADPSESPSTSSSCVDVEIDGTYESMWTVKATRGTALAREGSWFALLVAGVIVLAAMPFYRYLGATSKSAGCTSFGGGFICRAHLLSNGFFGMGLGSSAPGTFGNSSPNATTYWVISILFGLCVVIGFFWFRLRKNGNVGRIWPIVTFGLGALVLGVASRNWFSDVPTAMTKRGMQSLLIIALGLIVLAAIDHAWAISLYVVGFLGLALLSCLYDVSNLFSRLGISSHWPADDQTLPNLILPGIYLVVGGAAFWALHHWQIRHQSIQD
jgi:hypothetical protein